MIFFVGGGMMDTKEGTLHQDECSGNAHHWVIDGKNLGACKKCGAKKQFPAYVELWHGQKVVTGKRESV